MMHGIIELSKFLIVDIKDNLPEEFFNTSLVFCPQNRVRGLAIRWPTFFFLNKVRQYSLGFQGYKPTDLHALSIFCIDKVFSMMAKRAEKSLALYYGLFPGNHAKLLQFIAIRYGQRIKDAHIERLQGMRRMRWIDSQKDLIIVAEVDKLHSNMGPVAIRCKNTPMAIRIKVFKTISPVNFQKQPDI
jgi:hypothetical protein